MFEEEGDFKMDILIKNYKGISKLEYSLQDNKINFLFGISGSGKSSIAGALTDSDAASHVKVGECISSLNVKVNGIDPNIDSFKVYDLGYMNNILINKENKNDIYTILFGDGGSIENFRNDYNAAIMDLLSVKDEIVNALFNINSLINDLKISFKKNGDYSTSCLIDKLEKNVKTTPKFKNAVNYSTSEIKWILDGTKLVPYSLDKCPFCAKKLSSYRKNKISEILCFDAKTYEKINSKTGVFSSLSISAPNWNNVNDVKKFNKQIKEYYDIKTELEKLNSYIDIVNKTDFDNFELIIEKPSKRLFKLFPNVYNAVLTFNTRSIEIKKALGKLKSETQKVIKTNCGIINEKLSLLGIPYLFVKREINEDSHEADYVMVHKDDSFEKDMSNNLSFGEKNLIGLLLFLLANEKKFNLVIDDPASSFDEYRRKVIFDFIYDFHTNSTVLVLSHDHVFAKFAVFHRDDSKTKIERNQSISELKRKFYTDVGNIDFLESYNESKIIRIEKENFKNISDFIKDRIYSLGTTISYQLSVNLRLYYEFIKNTPSNNVVYQYLSAIIHKIKKEEITALLSAKGITEEDVLLKISREFDDRTYLPLPDNYLDSIDVGSFTNLEKIVLAREGLSRSKKDKILKDELSNIIHMNSALAVCLDPYKFNYFSRFVFEHIEKIS